MFYRRFDGLALIGVLLSTLGMTLPGHADAVADAGRVIAAKCQDAVVSVQVVSRTRVNYEGEEHTEEARVVAVGTVIDPTGLVAMSLTTISPAESMEDMMDMEGVTITSDITDVRIRLADGRELPASVVLRDRDRDLAFIRTVTPPASPLTALDLTATSVPGPLDQVIYVTRTGAIINRALAMTVDRIQAVVEKPRRFYFPGLVAMSSGLSAPAFALDGSVVGLLVLRTVPRGTEDESGVGSGMGQSNTMFIILPAEEIAEAAKEAMEVAR